MDVSSPNVYESMNVKKTMHTEQIFSKLFYL